MRLLFLIVLGFGLSNVCSQTNKFLERRYNCYQIVVRPRDRPSGLEMDSTQFYGAHWLVIFNVDTNLNRGTKPGNIQFFDQKSNSTDPDFSFSFDDVIAPKESRAFGDTLLSFDHLTSSEKVEGSIFFAPGDFIDSKEKNKYQFILANEHELINYQMREVLRKDF